jgi:hypothetical protein
LEKFVDKDLARFNLEGSHWRQVSLLCVLEGCDQRACDAI